jgi:hypothetical protein
MMEMTPSDGAQVQIQTSDSGPSCCKTIANHPVAMVAPSASRVLIEVMLVGETINLPVPDKKLSLVDARIQSNPRTNGRCQAVLCTFRI